MVGCILACRNAPLTVRLVRYIIAYRNLCAYRVKNIYVGWAMPTKTWIWWALSTQPFQGASRKTRIFFSQFLAASRTRLRGIKNLFEPRRHEERKGQMSKIGRDFPNSLHSRKGLEFRTYALTEILKYETELFIQEVDHNMIVRAG